MVEDERQAAPERVADRIQSPVAYDSLSRRHVNVARDTYWQTRNLPSPFHDNARGISCG